DVFLRRVGVLLPLEHEGPGHDVQVKPPDEAVDPAVLYPLRLLSRRRRQVLQPFQPPHDVHCLTPRFAAASTAVSRSMMSSVSLLPTAWFRMAVAARSCTFSSSLPSSRRSLATAAELAACSCPRACCMASWRARAYASRNSWSSRSQPRSVR